MLVRLQYLSEAALSNDLEDLVAVRHMVMGDVDVGALVVIVAAVVGSAHHPRTLLSTRSNEIHWRDDTLMKNTGGRIQWRENTLTPSPSPLHPKPLILTHSFLLSQHLSPVHPYTCHPHPLRVTLTLSSYLLGS